MKKMKLGLFTSLLAFTLVGCNDGSGSSTGPVNPDAQVTVNFYIDFNQPNSGETYKTVTVKYGSTVAKPDNPTTAPFAEFPTFLGWSEKEIIVSKDDLWDFSKDVVKSDSLVFSLYGIWVAEGEA